MPPWLAAPPDRPLQPNQPSQPARLRVSPLPQPPPCARPVDLPHANLPTPQNEHKYSPTHDHSPELRNRCPAAMALDPPSNRAYDQGMGVWRAISPRQTRIVLPLMPFERNSHATTINQGDLVSSVAGPPRRFRPLCWQGCLRQISETRRGESHQVHLDKAVRRR